MLSYSPPLADLVAIDSAQGLEATLNGFLPSSDLKVRPFSSPATESLRSASNRPS
jgi:hypothetical protein